MRAVYYNQIIEGFHKFEPKKIRAQDLALAAAMSGGGGDAEG